LRRGFFKMPAFLEATTWKGGSEIVKQYNYSAAKSFTLREVPTQPSGSNFSLCIKYRVGTTVTRYKIWDDGAILPQVEQYTNQTIKPNFCLEVWSWEDETTVINPVEFLFLAGEKKVPTDLRDSSGFYTTTEPSGTAATLATAVPSLDGVTVLGQWSAEIAESTLALQDLSGAGNSLASSAALTIAADSIIVETKNFHPSIALARTNVPYTSLNYQFGCVVNLISDGAVGAYDIITNLIARTGDTLTIKWPTFAGATLVYALQPDDFNANLAIQALISPDGLGDITYRFEIRNLQTDVVLATDSGTVAGLNDNITDIIFNETANNSAKILELLICEGLAGFDIDAQFTVVNDYFQDRFINLIGDQAIVLSDSSKWLDNTATIQSVTVSEDEVTLTPANFVDVVYVLNPTDGKYYTLTMTTVDGVTTTVVGETPVDLPIRSINKLNAASSLITSNPNFRTTVEDRSTKEQILGDSNLFNHLLIGVIHVIRQKVLEGRKELEDVRIEEVFIELNLLHILTNINDIFSRHRTNGIRKELRTDDWSRNFPNTTHYTALIGSPWKRLKHFLPSRPVLIILYLGFSQVIIQLIKRITFNFCPKIGAGW